MTIQKTVAARLIPIIFFLFSFVFFPLPPFSRATGDRERERDFRVAVFIGIGSGRLYSNFARARLSARLIARRALIAVCKLRGGRDARDTDSLPSPLPLLPMLIDFLFYVTRRRFMTRVYYIAALRIPHRVRFHLHVSIVYVAPTITRVRAHARARGAKETNAANYTITRG